MWHLCNRRAWLLFYTIAVYGTCQAATFTVTKTTDTTTTSVVGELRWAIKRCNATAGSSQILFNIPGTGPFTITPKQDLDAITKPVTINGYSQPGASANTLATGNNASLMIVLSGNNYTEGNAYEGTGNGLTFGSGSAGSTVKGLVINAWVNTGILIDGANSITIVGNFIGTNAAGTAQVANQAGLFIQSSNNTVIGTAAPADRNVIAGSFFFFNESSCIAIYGSNSSIIKNNYVGTNASGTATLGNSLAGIACISADGTIIGGATTAERNIVSGHAIVGVSLEAASSTQILGNYIGTDATGTHALGNQNLGICISGSGAVNSATSNVISSNLISGNRIGIKLGLASSLGANQNTVTKNLIGTDVTGLLALGNSYGVVINDNTNTVGGASLSARNVISANTVGGVLAYGSAQGNTITYNYIGLNSAGTAPLPNGYGVQLGVPGGHGAAPNNTVANNVFGGSNTQTTVGS
jgi:hypothetical protein